MTNEIIRVIPEEVRQLFPGYQKLTQEQQTAYEQVIAKLSSPKARASLQTPREGSTPFKVSFLRQAGIIKPISMYEAIEFARTQEGLAFLGDCYVDSDFNNICFLRSKTDNDVPENNYLIKRLMKEAGIKNIGKNTLVISGLNIVEDEESYYGLALTPTDKLKVVENPDYDYTPNQRNFSGIDEKGRIIFDKKGQFTLWTRDYGFSAAYLGRGRLLGSDGLRFAVSGAGGRVVGKVAEGDAKKVRDIEAILRGK